VASGAAGLGWDSIRTLFSLSVKIVASPWPVRAHPSGTDTLNVASGAAKGTKAWLSGMSPAGLVSPAGGLPAGCGAACVVGGGPAGAAGRVPPPEAQPAKAMAVMAAVIPTSAAALVRWVMHERGLMPLTVLTARVLKMRAPCHRTDPSALTVLT